VSKQSPLLLFAWSFKINKQNEWGYDKTVSRRRYAMVKQMYNAAGLVIFSEFALAIAMFWLTWKHIL